MSMHINAEEGQIAPTVLLPGDPLRAKWIADNYLTEVVQYNTVRNMFGYTGITSTGKRISVQGSGMGMPSLGIYVHELINSYGVTTIIRVGSAGSLVESLGCNSIVLAMGACSDSAMNQRRFHGLSFAPIADWSLLKKASFLSEEFNIPVHVGNIASVDKFYEDAEPHTWKIFSEYNAVAIEMESAELYTLAAKYRIRALSILTISDNLVTGQKLSSDERERSFAEMAKIALHIHD